MTLHIVVFRATLVDESVRDIHERMVVEMRELAEHLDDFVEWRDASDGLVYWGYVMFGSGASTIAWKEDPQHAEIHRRGEQMVYSDFATQVFEAVRGASWRRDPSAPST